MSNNLYNTMGPKNNMGNIMSQMNALKSDPVQFLANRKFNLPQNFQGGPKDIIQHLLNTGQMQQSQLTELQNKLGIQ